MRGLVVGVVLCVTTIAHASPAAEKLFRDGQQLLKDGKTAEACDAFRKSQELEARSGTLLNLGRCEELRGRVATAWEAYVQARAMANQIGDVDKAAAADAKVTELAARLPYLTIRIPQKPVGLVVKRDGWEVSLAELDHEVPIDPGRYEIEASAPGYVTWRSTAVVALGQKTALDVPALAVDPNAPKPSVTTATVVEATPPARLPAKRKLGFGAAIGVTTDSDLIFGVRIPIEIAAVGRGAIRALPTVFYARSEYPDDVYHIMKLYAPGLSLEYLAPLAPTFYIAAGLGVGMDLIDDNYGDGISTQAWGLARVSPTLRIGRSIDIGLHIQAVATSDRVVGLGELGVDYFFW